LLRVVKTSGESVRFDQEQRLPGRGYYICPLLVCIQKAEQRDVLSQDIGFTAIQSLYQELSTFIRPEKGRTFRGLLGMAIKSRQIVLGTTAIVDQISKGNIKLVILDSLIGQSTRNRIEVKIKQQNIPLLLLPDNFSLEKITGKTNCRCAGIIQSNFASAIQKAVIEIIG
jgi:predicted RNA-binding protein YlxR (DUF448 family)